MIKKIRYFIEFYLIRFFFFLSSVFGFKKSSKYSSFLSVIADNNLFSINRLARKNLSSSFPKMQIHHIDDVISKMWKHLSRLCGEYFYYSNMVNDDLIKYIEVDKISLEKINKIKKSKKGGIIFSAHFGNWDAGFYFLVKNGLKAKALYRPLNNKKVDDITSGRRKGYLIPKGYKGSKDIIREIKSGNYVISLLDQRSKDGILVDFFNRPALTSTSIIKLIVKYDIPLIPIFCVRKNNSHEFQLIVEDEIQRNKNLSIEDEIKYLALEVNKKIEEWVVKYPSQWFWVHDRWKL